MTNNTSAVPYVPVAGTHDWRGPGLKWWQEGSSFTAYMQQQGCVRLGRDWPFWSTALAGTFFAGRAHLAWMHGAYVLTDFLRTIPFEERNLISMSHGGQVAAMAAGKIPVHRLVTVGTPVRTDMAEVYSAVVCPWLHVFSTGLENRSQLLGARLRLRWDMPMPAVNRRVEGIGHAKLLRTPDRFSAVYQRVVLPFLRGEA